MERHRLRPRPLGTAGGGLASDTDPEADTPVSPLAEAAYEPAAPTLVFQSPRLAAYVERAAGQGAPLRFLLKASDYLEDVPIGAVNLYSGTTATRAILHGVPA